VNLKFQILAGAEVTRLKRDERQRLLTSSPTISKRVTRHAFTLVEILVVVVLLSLIVVALMAVFNGTQAAFRASVTQSDVLEGGRSVMGLLKGDLESLTPAYLNQTNFVPNFYAAVSNNFTQPLTGSSYSRTNVTQDVFFITRENQTWNGVGYFVRSNLPYSGLVGAPGVLYRFETNYSVAQFAQNPNVFFTAYDLARRGINPTNGVSRLLDGVMTFKVRAFDTNGFWIMTNHMNIVATNTAFGEVAQYDFYSNALPASLEIELGVLEDRALQRIESLGGSFQVQTNYLAQQAGKVHLFRQRIPIRSVDPSAYQ
jgi:prepilin-type N-terminal cleavage/methylation domain-containing protein